MSTPTPQRPRRAKIVFTEGDYHHALTCYQAAKEWVIRAGLFDVRGVGGMIGSPRFRGRDIAGKVIPDEWVNQPGWQTIVEIDFAECTVPNFVGWLKALPLPKHATLEFFA